MYILTLKGGSSATGDLISGELSLDAGYTMSRKCCSERGGFLTASWSADTGNSTTDGWAADAGASTPDKSSSDGGDSAIGVWSSGASAAGGTQIPPLQILYDH